MQIIKDRLFIINKPSIVTIGKFDGIHIGHRKLINEAVKASGPEFCSVVFTFDMSPSDFFSSSQKMIYTNEEKEMILSECDVDYIIEYPFDSYIANMTAEEFVQEILVNRLNASKVIVGDDFHFGKNRSGNPEILAELSDKYGIEAVIMSKECINNTEVSSSLIRDCLSEGKLEEANEMLLRPYSISGTVISGNKLGRTLDMPTINLKPGERKLLPPNGVYTSLVIYDNKTYSGVTNIGYKPTAPGINSLGVETYIMDFCKDIYGEKVTVMLLHRQRPEIKFNNLDELIAQMKKDKELAKENITKYHS